MGTSIRTRLISTIGFLLFFAGSHILTYAATRQRTTSHVLREAERSVQARLTKLNYWETIQKADGTFRLTISMAGGMYYWWNDAIPYFGIGTFLTAGGLAIYAHGRWPGRIQGSNMLTR
jgi:hypothetical protein